VRAGAGPLLFWQIIATQIAAGSTTASAALIKVVLAVLPRAPKHRVKPSAGYTRELGEECGQMGLALADASTLPRHLRLGTR
jgi:hypothetical protein